jgi:hypothetical protein
MPVIPSPAELMKALTAQGGIPTPAAAKAASVALPKLDPTLKAQVEAVVVRHLPAAPSQRGGAPIPRAAVVEAKQIIAEAVKAGRARSPRRAARAPRASKAPARRRSSSSPPVKVGGTMKRSDGSHVTVLAKHGFGGREFACYGRRVNTSSGKKAARIFCATVKHQGA